MLSGSEASPCAHGGQPGWSGATQGAQQKGFGLIILMMRGQQPLAGPQVFSKHGVACLACGGFEIAGVWVQRQRLDLQGQVGVCANLTTMVDPLCGCRLQTVVDMHDAHMLAPMARHPGVQQRTGIYPSAQRQHDATRVMRRRVSQGGKQA